MVDDRIVPDCHFLHIRIDGSRRFSVTAPNQFLNFTGNHFITAHGYIHDSHRTYDLAGRRYQGRISQIFPHLGHFLQHFVQLVFNPHACHLAAKVGQHAAGNLVDQYFGIYVKVRVHMELIYNFTLDAGEIFRQLIQCFQIQSGIPGTFLQRGHHSFRTGLACSSGEGGQRRVQNVHAGFRRFQGRHVAQACGAVVVQFQRNRYFLFQRFDQVFRAIRTQQARHVFNTDRIGPHLYHFLGQPHKVCRFMIRTGGIDQRALHMGAGFFPCPKGSFQVSRIIEGVKHTDNGDAVLHTLFDKLRYHVVGIMVVTQQVLAAQQHLDGRMGHPVTEDAKATPGIFIQKTQASIKGSAAPGFNGMIPHVVQFFQNGDHILHPHPGRN